MKCLILAAGYATRLYPLTENFPKPLLEVNGKTIIDWLIDDLNQTNYISEFIIISNHKYYDHFLNWKNNKKTVKNISIIDDGTISNEKRLGAVVDIELAIKQYHINDDLMVIAGDNVLDFSFKHFIEYFKQKNTTCVMRYYEPDLNKVKKSASLIINNNDQVVKMLEKPVNPKSHFCCPPFYIYHRNDLEQISLCLLNGGGKDAPGSFISWLYSKSPVHAYKMPGKRYDIGSLESYHQVCSIYQGINYEK